MKVNEKHMKHSGYSGFCCNFIGKGLDLEALYMATGRTCSWTSACAKFCKSLMAARCSGALPDLLR